MQRFAFDLARACTAAAALAALAGCSGNDGKISVAAADSPLTDKAGDHLFTVTLEDGRSDGYDMKTLAVKATPDGKSAVAVALVPHDKNGNGKLDKGETVDCMQGANNDFGAGVSGKDVKVELFATIDGKSDERVGDAIWKPK